MQAKITIRLVKSLTPRAQPYEIFDTDLTGFLLRVQPSGYMSYYLAYRARNGRGKRFRVGRADAGRRRLHAVIDIPGSPLTYFPGPGTHPSLRL